MEVKITIKKYNGHELHLYNSGSQVVIMKDSKLIKILRFKSKKSIEELEASAYKFID